LTAFWAGPFVTHYLATLGADVIKVESIQRPDGIRFASVKQPPSADWWEWSPMFHAFNVGKRGITLDLGRPRGLELAKRLVRRADALVENFSPRVLDNLGLGHAALAELNPRLITVRMPAFGLDGPWRDRVGFAQTMEQMSGMAWITGSADGPPVIPRGPCDPLAGMHAAIALLVALEHRRTTGQGQLIEATMVEAALNAAVEQVIEHQAYGRLLSRDGNRGPVGAPQNLYPCRGDDQWIAIAVTSDEEWRALRALLGDPAWARDPRLASARGRRAEHDRIDVELRRWLASRDAGEVADVLLAAGIPAAPLVGANEAPRNPHLLARGFYEYLTHSIVGTHPFAGLPIGTPPSGRWYESPAPTLGQNNDEILHDLLGLSADEIAELRKDGIIGERPAGA
jgi:crotonobetainyl-CoA:carnitine CoA-transferase CaiB-like acyl-CoA transferase